MKRHPNRFVGGGCRIVRCFRQTARRPANRPLILSLFIDFFIVCPFVSLLEHLYGTELNLMESINQSFFLLFLYSSFGFAV